MEDPGWPVLQVLGTKGHVEVSSEIALRQQEAECHTCSRPLQPRQEPAALTLRIPLMEAQRWWLYWHSISVSCSLTSGSALFTRRYPVGLEDRGTSHPHPGAAAWSPLGDQILSHNLTAPLPLAGSFAVTQGAGVQGPPTVSRALLPTVLPQFPLQKSRWGQGTPSRPKFVLYHPDAEKRGT